MSEEISKQLDDTRKWQQLIAVQIRSHRADTGTVLRRLGRFGGEHPTSQAAATRTSLYLSSVFGHLNPSGRKIEHLSLLDPRETNPVQIARAVQTRDHPMQHYMVWIADLS
jgi:hypothetical protein